jgi:uncharacterized damage-inducible protein DinB
MAIRDAMLPEFDHERALTRKHLERVPDGKFDWKPHAKSFTFGVLATHLAEIPHWTALTIDKDELDLAPPGAPPYKPTVAKTQKELLAIFDKNSVEARAAIAKAEDAHLMKPWSLLMGGKNIMTVPRAAVLRSFILSHTIHHRAQLGVYLRLNDIAVPSTYGPSADEGAM